jgi:uncharacterized membrane protein YphA (DoxX/SURF4 family)
MRHSAEATPTLESANVTSSAPGRLAMTAEDIGSFLIRVTVAWLFLSGAWASGKDESRRKCVTADTALVFKWRPDLFALVGIFMAAAGGLSVLLGVFPRIGALALTIFLVPAAMIHLAMRRQAMALKEKIRDGLTGKISFSARNDVDALGDLAALGNYTSALKNLSLIGPTAYLVLAGARPPMLIGFGPDWQLHGLLTQL